MAVSKSTEGQKFIIVGLGGQLCRMRSGNQLNPLLRTLGRLCLNGGTYSTSQEVLLTASIQAEDCIRRDVHRTPYLQSEIKQNTNSGFGIRESKFRATNVSHLVNSASCLDFVRGSSALLSTSTEGSALRPPDAEGTCSIFFCSFVFRYMCKIFFCRGTTKLHIYI